MSADILQLAPAARAEQSLVARREYFITHAPEMPPWFRYEPSEVPPNPLEPNAEQELSEAHQKELAAWAAGSETDFSSLSSPVREFMVRWQRVQDARKKFREWQMQSRERKWWAWREYFADMMMERENGK